MQTLYPALDSSVTTHLHEELAGQQVCLTLSSAIGPCGRLLVLARDSVRLETVHGLQAVPTPDVYIIETTNRAKGAAQGVAIGGGMGAAAGAVAGGLVVIAQLIVGALTLNDTGADPDLPRKMAVSVGVSGLVIGGVIGHREGHRKRYILR